MNKTDLFICHTQKSKVCIKKEGYGHKKVEVIPLGVDLDRFKPKKSSNQRQKTILFVGRLVEEKGVMDLYEAFKNCFLTSKSDNPKLLLIGEGYLKKKLIRISQIDGLENSINIENHPYESIHQIYKKADLLVLPSKSTKTWEEQYGMVLLEALATGLPIIAYDSGAIKEVLQGTNLLIKEGDKKALAYSIKRLIGNVDLSAKMRLKSRKLAEKRYNCNDKQKKILKLYLSLL